MEFLFVIFYKKIDKVSTEMLYLVNKILLLEQLVLDGKKTALINFALLHDFTAFADIPVFVKYLFLGANVFPVYGYGKQERDGKAVTARGLGNPISI
ncbi:hypothetical protein D3Z53_26440 [Lachnospiraceae bacterium]|nr:hypothetical protein [Lachnospiraceae bacterium]